jgi:ribosomal protein S18 acetylase RimI-like enzyme
MIKTIQNLDEVMDFAWDLSRDNFHASYPRINSMEELKVELERAINLEDRSIIACYHQDVLCGVCFYFWISDEKYAQTAGFLVRGDYDQVADEFISHIREHLPGYGLMLGVPSTNKNANDYFTKKNFQRLDSSIVTAMYNLKSHGNESHDQVERIIKSNFEEYALFHDKHAIPLGMYFNSKNLQKTIDRFRIFAFKQDGEIRGSMFTKAFKDGGDVVGLFVDSEYKNKGIESILINETLMQFYNEFGSIKEILYFIDEDSTDELDAALAAGFVIKEKYRLYKCML